ncbi:hypothetical protein J4475_00450 [Candidatus Woesearchaeota archaeon]|nr:hypothetical protein [Candidatus Woesearchaeota archaeon]
MVYVRNNVNIILVLALVLSLLMLAGLTTIYQSSYRDLSSNFDKTSTGLKETGRNLTKTQKELDQLTATVQLRTADTDKFNKLYTDLLVVKGSLETELDKAKTQLKDTNEQLLKKIVELQNAQGTIATLSLSLSDAQNEIDRLNDRVAELEAQVAELSN